MNTASLLHYLSPILTILLASTLVLITTSDGTPPPSLPVLGGCSDSIISIAPCLPYISAPPNDLSDEPSSECCDIFNGAFESGEAGCLCYLVLQSMLLGFPINASKLLSLSDLCSVNNNNQGSHPSNTNISLESICLGSPNLPPPNNPHSGSNAPPPPSIITMPSSTNSALGQTLSKPSTSQQSRNVNDLTQANAMALMSNYFMLFVSELQTPINILDQFLADWGANPDDCTSTRAYVVFLGSNPISWSSTKQRTVVRSSTEVESSAIASIAAEMEWIKSLPQELHFTPKYVPVLYTDNLGATYLCANPIFHSRMKHLAMDYHFVRVLVQSHTLRVARIYSISYLL